MAARSKELATTRPAGVVPRWEWRTFGAGFGAAFDLLAGLTPQREGSTEELYFVSVHSDASVKVRDGMMDVKQLLCVDDDGLELWTPKRRQIAGLQAARADVILAGACIVRTIFTKLQTDSMTVSDRGLRHGVVLSRFAD